MLDVQEIRVPCGTDELQAVLARPAPVRGLVMFAHGSGSSRHSTRNRQVAQVLNDAGFATLLLDLLTQSEDAVDRRTAQHRFDIGLLSRRFVEATRWIDQERDLSGLPMGYFGASTGSAVALVASVELDGRIGAIVSRGGRPDLAGDAVLAAVRAPTLLIVGEADTAVIPLNEQAAARMRCAHKLEFVRGATHLFEEPGALEEVAALARDWFVAHLDAHAGA